MAEIIAFNISLVERHYTEAHKGHHCKYFSARFFLFPQGFFFISARFFFYFRKVFFISARFTYLRKVLFISARFVSFPQGYIISARFISFPQGYFLFPRGLFLFCKVYFTSMPISLQYCSKRAITPNDLGLPVPWWLPLRIFSRKLK